METRIRDFFLLLFKKENLWKKSHIIIKNNVALNLNYLLIDAIKTTPVKILSYFCFIPRYI